MQTLADAGHVRVVVLGRGPKKLVGREPLVALPSPTIEEPFPGTPFFESIGKSFDYYGDDPVVVSNIRTEKDRIFKEIFYIPALLLLGLVYWMQSRRRAAT